METSRERVQSSPTPPQPAGDASAPLSSPRTSADTVPPNTANEKSSAARRSKREKSLNSAAAPDSGGDANDEPAKNDDRTRQSGNVGEHATSADTVASNANNDHMPYGSDSHSEPPLFPSISLDAFWTMASAANEQLSVNDEQPSKERLLAFRIYLYQSGVAPLLCRVLRLLYDEGRATNEWPQSAVDFVRTRLFALTRLTDECRQVGSLERIDERLRQARRNGDRLRRRKRQLRLRVKALSMRKQTLVEAQQRKAEEERAAENGSGGGSPLDSKADDARAAVSKFDVSFRAHSRDGHGKTPKDLKKVLPSPPLKKKK